MTTVYLAGGMAGLQDKDCKVWRDTATQLLSGCQILNPMVRDYRFTINEPYESIVEDDCDDILKSDIVLVRLDVPSWGTAMEIRFAFDKGKRIYGFSENGLFWDALSPWVKYHVTDYFASLSRACEYINIVDCYSNN